MSDVNPVVGVKDDAINLVRKANDRTYAAESRVRELEAQCAAMREALGLAARALEDSGVPCSDDATHERCEVCYAANACRDALSSDAGRAMLERVEAQDRRIKALEQVAKAAQEFRSAVAPMDYDATAKALDLYLDALRALDALEPQP